MTVWEVPAEYFSAESVTPSAAVTSGIIDHLKIVDTHVLQVETSSFTGSFLIVQLQGSLDGVGWYTLLTVNPSANGTTEANGGLPARYTRVFAEPEDGSTSGTINAFAASGTT